MHRLVASILLPTLVLGAVGFSIPGPAYASTQLSATCVPTRHFLPAKLYASAWYTTPTSTYHHWTGTSFDIWQGDKARNENNIDIWVYAGGNIWAHRSADNIAGTYTYDSNRYPTFALNVDTPSYLTDEHVAFRAIFDEPRNPPPPMPDPRCSAVTYNI